MSGAEAERRPRFDLSIDVTRSERAQRVAPPSYSGENIYTDRDLIIAETRMRVPIYQGGRIEARVHQADLALMASRQELITHKQRLILDVVAIYTQLQEQWATIRALNANRDALQENLAVVDALEEVGRVPHLDALKVEVRLAALVQQASQADRNLAILKIRLGRLMGLVSDAPQPEVSSDPVEIQTCRVEDEPDIVSIAVEQRHEVRGARARVDKALAEVTVARSQGRPEVNGVVAYSYRSGVPWTNLEDVDRHVAYLWAGVGVNVPLWTGGRTGAAVAEAKALRRSAEADLEALRLEVGEQVKQALATLQEARDRVGVARTAAIQANEALAIEQSSYEIGRAVVNDVLDAQAALLEAQLDQASALADVALSSAALEYTLGNDLQQAIQRDKGGCP